MRPKGRQRGSKQARRALSVRARERQQLRRGQDLHAGRYQTTGRRSLHEHCPPDVAAAFICLKNRDPDRWRDVQNVEHVLGKYIISDHPMTEEEWARERATVIDETVVEELPAPSSHE
jgi:hypothetical protein